MLSQLGIPLLASERGDDHPLVFGGGPVLTANPEPYANFFDIVLLGEWVGAAGARRQGTGWLRSSCAKHPPNSNADTPAPILVGNLRLFTLSVGAPCALFAGDGEELLSSFTERLLEVKQGLAEEAEARGGGGAPSRRQLLLALAAVPGVYVPQVSPSTAAGLLPPMQSGQL
jgi:hypothetical protein